jgi:glyoxylase-like metal-dependent hydrolase (beta-lactamase superfamily II)
MVALHRERDGLALTSDAFYTVNPETSRPTPPQIPHAAFTPDPDQARASLRKLATLGLSAAWPGHASPLTGDVSAQLAQAAER